MFYLLALLWAIMLAALTCTASLKLLFHFHRFHFVLIPRPDLSEFFNLHDMTKVHGSFWYYAKLGHFLGFAILLIPREFCYLQYYIP